MYEWQNAGEQYGPTHTTVVIYIAKCRVGSKSQVPNLIAGS